MFGCWVIWQCQWWAEVVSAMIKLCQRMCWMWWAAGETVLMNTNGSNNCSDVTDRAVDDDGVVDTAMCHPDEMHLFTIRYERR